MKKIYQYGFWVLLLLSFSLFNLWQITTNENEKKVDAIIRQNSKRLQSLLSSNIVSKRKIPSPNGINIISNKKKQEVIGDTAIVILLSDFKCNKCQINELQRLDSVQNTLKSRKFAIIGITTKDKKNRTITQTKIARISFPIFWIEKKVFYNKLAFDDEFPQVLIITNEIIVAAFKPIPKDDNFSEMFYNKLL